MIRRATQEDVSRLAEILIFGKRTAFRDIFKNDKVSFGEMQVLPLAIQFQQYPELIANVFVYDDEIVKGMINISTENNVAEVKEIYIDPFFLSQQVGSKLMAFAENRIVDLGMSEIFLWVLEKNEVAKRFYERHGFVATDEKKLEEGTSEYIVKYRKENCTKVD